jgi:uncharacterized protein (TIGR02117 family)
MRKIFKYIGTFFLLIFGIILLYLVSASIGSLIVVNQDFRETDNGISIYITTNGVHTDFILPVFADSVDWQKIVRLSDFPSECSRCKYISFGWGEKEFYLNTPQWKDIRFKTALHAAFIPSETAISVQYLTYQPTESKSSKKIRISPNQYSILTSYIASSFRYDSAGNLINSRKNSPGFEQFYDGLGKYSGFYTCNNWTASGLKKAGISAPLWSPFDKGVMYVLNKKVKNEK